MKICAHCKENKLLDCFGRDRTRADGLKHYCRTCANLASIRSRARLVVDPLTGELTTAATRANNKLRQTPEGREKAREAARLGKTKRYQNGKHAASLLNSPVRALRETIASLIRNSLKARNQEKQAKTQQLLGCSIAEFKLYIETQFVGEMSWENQGAWHFDHRIPCACAKTITELTALQHWSNFQPMWAADNLSKGCDAPDGWALELRLLTRISQNT